MKVCIVGAGAIGGFIGTRLALAGQCETYALARGATLDALQTHGWRLNQAGESLTAPVTASDRPEALGRQDLVIVAVKSQALGAVAPAIATLCGPHTVVLPMMNGVPWWFVAGRPGLGDQPLESVDPGGRIAALIPVSRVLGGVVHASCSTPEPGLVQHRMGQGLIVGEPAGGGSERVDEVVALLSHAGFDATVSTDIRQALWYKLWGNLTMNPVSALTGATIDRIHDDPQVLALCSAAMREAQAIGAAIGCPIDQTPDDRHAVTRKLGAFRTSMLQDVDAHRPIELDAIVTAVHELGLRTGVPTPMVDALLGLTRLMARVRGLYPGG